MPKIKLSIEIILLSLAGFAVWLQAASMVYLELSGVNAELARPWTIIEAGFRFSHVPGNTENVLIGLGAPLATFAAIAVALIVSKPQKPFGDARWARESELRKAGLRAPNGILLGRKGNDYLRHDGPAHVLVSAPIHSNL